MAQTIERETHAIYELDSTGVDGAYEATGLIHFYCSLNHAGRHAIAEGYRTSANFSKPQPSTDHGDSTKCEWCGQIVSGADSQI